MLQQLIRRKWPIALLALVVVVAIGVVALGGSAKTADSIVVYNGRSHYGDEQVFLEFEKFSGIKVILRGGTAPELYERLLREGDDTPADVLVTTDLANLWRAEDAGLLQPTSSDELRENVPASLHDPGEQWWAISTRLRVPVVSTERVRPGEVTSYEDLGDPKFKGRTCLRTSNNEYNQSLVADMIAKRGRKATDALLRSWMANSPRIINSDGELLAVIAAGRCDVGLTNHYYLGRSLDEKPDFPVAPAWPDQRGAGAHANVSGAGVVRASKHKDEATQLIEYLTSPYAQRMIVSGSEFPVNSHVKPASHIRDWVDVKTDPIDVDRAGPKLEEAIALMLEVGWR